MRDNAGNYYIFNNRIEPVNNFENMGDLKGTEVYEVIRIIEGVPLFFEDHFSRLETSFKLLGINLNITAQGLREQIFRLMRTSNISNCNVKLIVFAQENVQDLLLYISKSYYPANEEFEKGVPVGLIHWDRDNPNAKVVNNVYKEKVSKKIEHEKVFEVLLVNKNNKVTEGSKSNTFFVKGSKVFTAPGQFVLKGITRKYIIDTCEKLGIEVVETLLDLNDLNDVEGLFISGTSIKVLPVSKVEKVNFESSFHPLIVSIRKAFDAFIDGYINNNKSS